MIISYRCKDQTILKKSYEKYSYSLPWLHLSHIMTQSPASQSQSISQKISNLISSPVIRGSQSDASFNDAETVNDLDFTNLRGDQETIDSTLKFLLNYNVHKKKRGRPAFNTNEEKNVPDRLTVPDSVNDSLKTITNVSQLHAGVLIDYLIKSNNSIKFYWRD